MPKGKKKRRQYDVKDIEKAMKMVRDGKARYLKIATIYTAIHVF